MISRRQDLKDAIERDAQRIKRRENAPDSFWRSISVLGSVGWPIVLFAAGAGLLGRWMDQRWGTGVHFTLMLLFLGAAAGSAIAWRAVRGTRP